MIDDWLVFPSEVEVSPSFTEFSSALLGFCSFYKGILQGQRNLRVFQGRRWIKAWSYLVLWDSRGLHWVLPFVFHVFF